MKSLAIRAQAKGLELACPIPSGCARRADRRPGPRSQIIVNLVGNATKFTERGEIVLEIHRRVADDATA